MARPRKQVLEGEQDDEPTYVVEDSQDTLSKAECEALLATKDEDKQNEKNVTSSSEVRHGSEGAALRKDWLSGEAALGKQEVAGIGYSTKRRLAKIVGDEEEKKEATPETNDSRKPDTKTRAHRRKKMKLSFDDYTDA